MLARSVRHERARQFLDGPHRAALGLVVHHDEAGPRGRCGGQELRDLVRDIPLERLLVETDAPFLAPVPHRGKRNEPSFVAETARVLAEAKGVSFSEVAEKTTGNVLKIFNKMTAIPA